GQPPENYDQRRGGGEMMRTLRRITILLVFLLLPSLSHAAVLCVRDFGAAGDGKTIDTPAINKAIDAAAAKGGGTVLVPAGDYLSVSIHLKSNVALHLMQGATIVGASEKDGHPYDDPEPNPSGEKEYQDF